jgi:hypothetical protein
LQGGNLGAKSFQEITQKKKIGINQLHKLNYCLMRLIQKGYQTKAIVVGRKLFSIYASIKMLACLALSLMPLRSFSLHVNLLGLTMDANWRDIFNGLLPPLILKACWSSNPKAISTNEMVHRSSWQPSKPS